jgi:hypothetical protein
MIEGLGNAGCTAQLLVFVENGSSAQCTSSSQATDIDNFRRSFRHRIRWLHGDITESLDPNQAHVRSERKLEQERFLL